MNKIIGNAIPILNLNDLNFSAERAGEKLTTPDGGKNTNVLEIQKQESISKKSSIHFQYSSSSRNRVLFYSLFIILSSKSTHVTCNVGSYSHVHSLPPLG